MRDPSLRKAFVQDDTLGAKPSFRMTRLGDNAFVQDDKFGATKVSSERITIRARQFDFDPDETVFHFDGKSLNIGFRLRQAVAAAYIVSPAVHGTGYNRAVEFAACEVGFHVTAGGIDAIQRSINVENSKRPPEQSD